MKKIIKYLLTLFSIFVLTGCTFFEARYTMIEYIKTTIKAPGGQLLFYEDKTGVGVEKDEYYMFYNEYYSQVGLFNQMDAQGMSFDLQLVFFDKTDAITSFRFEYGDSPKTLLFECIGEFENRTLGGENSNIIVANYRRFDDSTAPLNFYLDIFSNAVYKTLNIFGEYGCPLFGLTIQQFKFKNF